MMEEFPRRLLPEVAAYLMRKHGFLLSDEAYIRHTRNGFEGCPIGALLYEERGKEYRAHDSHEFFTAWSGSAAYAIGYDRGFHNFTKQRGSLDADLYDLGEFDGRSARAELCIDDTLPVLFVAIPS